MSAENAGPTGNGAVRAGDLVGGHRIERPLGAGAMGTVWLAEHVTLGRRVALKILADGLAHDRSFQDRFMREARLAARLDHPNVVAVYDAGTDDAGLWLSMRYVEGEDLRRRLNRVAAATGADPAPVQRSPSPFRRPEPADTPATTPGGGPGDAPGGLPPAEAVRIVEGVAAGLDHAHSRGIIHRDVKPGNVLIEAEPGVVPAPAPPAGTVAARSGDVVLPPFSRVLLADFGLTKELEEGTDLTQTGMLLGSADSVSPEQIEGRATDARVDVYALGSLLHVALTGTSPFPGATMAKLFAHVNGERPRVSALHPELRAFDAVIAAGMAKDPAARPSTAGELAALAHDALERIDVDPQATVAFPPPVPPPARTRGATPRPRPTPPAGAPAPRFRDEPTPTDPPTPTERTRVAPAPPRPAVPSARPAPRYAAPAPPPAASSGRATGSGGSPPWLVPALVLGALAFALVVVLALGGGGGGDDDDPGTSGVRADGGTTSTRADRTGTDEAPATTETSPATGTGQAAPTSTGTAPATGDEVAVQGGGVIAAGAATRDPGGGQPLASGTPADYVAPDRSWRTLVARPGDGWEAPVRSDQGAIARLRQSGPGGRVILVDHTPTQPASFDPSNTLERRSIDGTRFGTVTAYRFRDDRFRGIAECARLQCIDASLNGSKGGPGWGVLVAAPTAAEAWATMERVARATGP